MNEEQEKRVIELMRACGEIMLNADRSTIGIEAKEGHANFVTRYDKLVQDTIARGLKEIMPEAGFYGEESEKHEDVSKGYVFIVDPIDGTTNFIKDYKHSCISIGLACDAESIWGAVYNPYTEELFSARKGGGAFLNGKPIHVSNCRLKDALVLFGTAPYYDDVREISMEKAKEYLVKAVDLRRSGSAALDLCSVAAGRADLFFEYRLQPWDFAAGMLIVEEAGGKVTTPDGKPVSVLSYSAVMAQGKGIALEKL